MRKRFSIRNKALYLSVILALSLLSFAGCGAQSAPDAPSASVITGGTTGEDVSAAAEDEVLSAGEAFELIDRLISSDVAHGFPGAQLAVMKDGVFIFEGAWGSTNAYHPDGTPKTDSAPVTAETLFDLASITKMFAVNYAVQKLVTDGMLDLDTRVVDILDAPFSDNTLMYDRLDTDADTMRAWKERITVRNLLQHEAGMPPDPRSFSQYMEVAMGPHTREDVLQSLFRVPLRYEPGTETLYSDLDYMLLCFIVERVTGSALDDYLRETFFKPLGLSHITYNPLQNGFSADGIAATELNGNTRDGYVSHAGIRTYTLQGEVHDENAFHAMDGVSGHAGLFANAHDLAVLASLMMTGEHDSTRFFSRDILEQFTAPKSADEPEWGIGWWRADGGKRPGFFSAYASESAIGHNGWTGTQVIIDPAEQLVIVYLTNRINSPVTNPEKDLERFDGSYYTAGANAFVPSVLYRSALTAGAVPRDELIPVVEAFARSSFSLLPDGVTPESDHPAVKNAESKLALFSQYAEESGEATDTEKAAHLAAEWKRSSPETGDPFRWDETVRNGDTRFDAYIPQLSGKRVALFTNHTGMVYDGQSEQHILDVLTERDVNVTAVFAPEHGIRGDADAGGQVEDTVDEKTGVPVYSLYRDGRTQMPSAEQADRFDVLVVDIQDVGVRFYTYYLTMFDLMDTCAAHGKQMMVLDRANPNGFYVDGPTLREELHSGVGRLPLPVVHGMTLGELAGMINGEGWLSAGKDALDLTVIPCENYTHSMKPYIPVAPSPNLKDMRALYLYPSTALFENTAVSVGRGTEEPFVVFGSPYLASVAAYDFTFTPQSMPGASDPPFLNETCYGKRLRGMSFGRLTGGSIDVSYVVDAYRAMQEAYPGIDFFGAPDAAGHYWIDYLCGTERVRNMITEGKSADEVRADWMEDVALFKKQRQPYLLYEE